MPARPEPTQPHKPQQAEDEQLTDKIESLKPQR
jgi:hypothetical protein